MKASLGSTTTPGLGNNEVPVCERSLTLFCVNPVHTLACKTKVFSAVECIGKHPVSLKIQKAVSSKAEPSYFSNNLNGGKEVTITSVVSNGE